jgi:hypothetical protein
MYVGAMDIDTVFPAVVKVGYVVITLVDGMVGVTVVDGGVGITVLGGIAVVKSN